MSHRGSYRRCTLPEPAETRMLHAQSLLPSARLRDRGVRIIWRLSSLWGPIETHEAAHEVARCCHNRAVHY
jgi:hypothetical protein